MTPSRDSGMAPREGHDLEIPVRPPESRYQFPPPRETCPLDANPAGLFFEPTG